jgi:hypothetical protein
MPPNIHHFSNQNLRLCHFPPVQSFSRTRLDTSLDRTIFIPNRTLETRPRQTRLKATQDCATPKHHPIKMQSSTQITSALGHRRRFRYSRLDQASILYHHDGRLPPSSLPNVQSKGNTVSIPRSSQLRQGHTTCKGTLINPKSQLPAPKPIPITTNLVHPITIHWETCDLGIYLAISIEINI